VTTREALLAEHEGVLGELHALRGAVSLASRDKTYARSDDFKEKQRQLARLKRREQKIRDQLSALGRAGRAQNHRRQHRREEIFIDLARKRLGEVVYQELWAEVDRLEREQWRNTWSVP
jgi:hypothetical protein